MNIPRSRIWLENMGIFMRTVTLLTSLAFAATALAAVPAAAQPSAIKVMVTSSCDQGAPRFEIVNAGGLWPEMMTIALVRMDTQTVITQRELRMRPAQKIVYRAKDAPKEIEIGVKIESESFKRPPGGDSIIACAAAPAAPK
ncbi:MAG: hypothetical protein IT564_03905 [Rhodospirillales bacterium]|nr:hypothetical protein [Rhodospirillales bacterium]